MAQAIGLATVFGVSQFEGTYGTAAAVDRRLEIVSDGVQYQQNVQQSQGISGELSFAPLGSRRTVLTDKAAGATVHELAKNGMGVILNAMTGGTSNIAQQGATAAWLQQHASGGFAGRSVTLQRSVRDSTGTEVSAFTQTGCKVAQWELTVSSDSIPQLTLTWDCASEVTNVSSAALLALPAPAGGNFSYQDVSVTLGGAPLDDAFELTVTGTNPMSTDRYSLGSSNLQREPDLNERKTVTGTIVADYVDPATFYDTFVSGAGQALVVTFTGNNIETTFDEEFVLTVPQVHLTGETPVTGGPDLISINSQFEASYTGTGDFYSIDYQSTDTAI